MLDVSPFANRLAKNYKHHAKWARRQGLDAWRVYDKDVPQFPFAVDLYGERVHLQEYDTGWEMEDDAYRDWINAVVDSLCAVTGVAPEAVTLKNRRRQKGVSQYEKVGQLGDDFIIDEFGQRFIVNLDAYLDTGLFLDHRNTRKRVREEPPASAFSICSPIPAASPSMPPAAARPVRRRWTCPIPIRIGRAATSNSTAWTSPGINWCAPMCSSTWKTRWMAASSST